MANEKQETPIHELKIHETSLVRTGSQNFKVTRVPGGWLYTTYKGDSVAMVFVPINSEGSESSGASFTGTPGAH